MIRSSLLLTALVCASATVVAQSNVKNWFSFDSPTSVDEVVADRSSLGLTEDASLKPIRVDEDNIGMRHHRYQQVVGGIPVEGAVFLIHEKNSVAVSANGRLVKGVQPGTPAISEQQAIVVALNHVGGTRYAWESPAAEDLLIRMTGNPTASYYPKPELVYFSPSLPQSGEEYRLCFKLEVYSLSPNKRVEVFVDASSGAVVDELSLIHTGNANGSAVTRYSDTQNVVTDSIGPGYFRLRDYSRGGGIETYNMHTVSSDFIPDSAIDFVDFDNFWDNANAEMDEVGGDVHWGAEMSYDYFFNQHNRDSYDGNGKTIVSYVHVGQNWFNARFSGDWMEYGDGNNNPLTSLDVVAHELSHGVTRHTAGLIYQNESGALNESFSDVFGASVEHYTLPDSMSDWEIGKANFTLRSMSNPNAYGHPDTYKGTNWHTSPWDNGGVHTNSGVQNYWFYLLSEGGQGTNDNGDAFSVTGIGIDSAAAIAYRNLAYYLTPTSQYLDARQGAIQATADLYGSCSWEVMEVARAWQAVGVGNDSLTRDFQITRFLTPSTGCGLSNNEAVSVEVVYHKSGCEDYVEPAENVTISYALNGGVPVTEPLLLLDTLWGGDTLYHVFNQSADLSSYGTHDLKAWVSFWDDAQVANDTADVLTVIHPVDLSNSGITFETQTAAYDSLYTQTNSRSFINITPLAANLSSYGLRMTGDDPDHDRDFVVPPTQSDIWTQNPDYLAKACLCVDATGWNTAYLKFDLKQSFSMWYNQEYGFDLPLLASSMRVSVNGTPVTNDYHPNSYKTDPYFSRTLDLSAYAGTQFEVCFETMNFMKHEEDPVFGSIGDNAYLDNIWVSEDYVASVPSPERLAFSFYPNPTTGQVLVSTGKGPFNMHVFDVAGRVVLNHHSDRSSTEINLGGLQRGSYFIQVYTEKEESEVEQIILH